MRDAIDSEPNIPAAARPPARPKSPVRSKGQARIAVWEGGSLWVLQADAGFGEADFHAHHAIQITMALDGAFELRTVDEKLSGPFVGVAADASHIFDAYGLIAFLFIEPESQAGRAFAMRYFNDRQLTAIPSALLRPAVDRLSATFSAPLDNSELVEIGKGIIHALAGGGDARMPDERIHAVLAYAARHLEDGVTLAEAAEGLSLSHSRLRHLFVEQTGLPFKTYLLWLRLMKAMEVYAGGNSLTTAAHEAGFADSAHFSRTFRRTFGLPATTLTLL